MANKKNRLKQFKKQKEEIRVLLLDTDSNVHQVVANIKKGLMFHNTNIFIAGSGLQNADHTIFNSCILNMGGPLVIKGKNTTITQCHINGNNNPYPFSDDAELPNIESILNYIEKKEAKGETVKSSTLRFIFGL
jgi:hypothetical protein